MREEAEQKLRRCQAVPCRQGQRPCWIRVVAGEGKEKTPLSAAPPDDFTWFGDVNVGIVVVIGADVLAGEGRKYLRQHPCVRRSCLRELRRGGNEWMWRQIRLRRAGRGYEMWWWRSW
eukprot:751872-Hanusia_phi.AAC.4